MASPKSAIPPAAKPRHSAFFDAWNSSSTGHQRAENKAGASTGWRLSRTANLSVQFRAGNSLRSNKSKSQKILEPQDLRSTDRISHHKTCGLQSSIKDALVLKENGTGRLPCPMASLSANESESRDSLDTTKSSAKDHSLGSLDPQITSRTKGIFDGLVIYVNGSTYPLVSDHKLKHMLAENGAKLSIHLGRKQVTHVILGRPCGTDFAGTRSHSGPGVGGGLAGTKVQKEIKRVGGCGVKYVDVEWKGIGQCKGGQETVRGKVFEFAYCSPRAEECAVCLFYCAEPNELNHANE